MPQKDNAPLIEDHSYDGIQEFDNPLPGWWKMLFILSIIYSVLYVFFFHGGASGRGIIDQYDRALAANLRLQFAEIGELTPDRETLLFYADDGKWLKFGESTFLTNCKSCHGAKGEGQVGPNLCDEHWKNVKSIEDIAKVVANGAAGKAMPAWGTRLHPNEVVFVACYVASLRGTLSEGEGKKPEGKVIPAWDAEPETESKTEPTPPTKPAAVTTEPTSKPVPTTKPPVKPPVTKTPETPKEQ